MVSLLATYDVQVKQVQRTNRGLKTDKLGSFSGQIRELMRTNQGTNADKLRNPILVVIKLLYNCLYSCYIVVIKRACARLGNSLRSFRVFQEYVE